MTAWIKLGGDAEDCGGSRGPRPFAQGCGATASLTVRRRNPWLRKFYFGQAPEACPTTPGT
jgi:hypothetical protein